MGATLGLVGGLVLIVLVSMRWVKSSAEGKGEMKERAVNLGVTVRAIEDYERSRGNVRSRGRALRDRLRGARQP